MTDVLFSSFFVLVHFAMYACMFSLPSTVSGLVVVYVIKMLSLEFWSRYGMPRHCYRMLFMKSILLIRVQVTMDNGQLPVRDRGL